MRAMTTWMAAAALAWSAAVSAVEVGGVRVDDKASVGGQELVLNGANLNFVAFSRYSPLGIDGQSIALFVIVLAAAEAAVALAIALNFYNNHLTIDVDRGKDLQG